MIEFNYSIANNTLNGTVNYDAIVSQFNKLNRPEVLQSLTITGDNLKFVFASSNDVNALDAALDSLVANHNGLPLSKPKILSLTRNNVGDKDFRDIDYKKELNITLYPKRTFVKGELQLVQWFSDSQLQNEIIRVEIVYTRDYFGFAQSRVTTRKWMNEDGSFNELTKVTYKNYTINPVEQIIEGKTRRENIVNGVQLPTLQFMIETMQGTQTQILLTGREFMDRFSLHFKNFIDNSSSVTDPNDPNYGKKTVVVAFEEAANSTDTWLNNLPQSLGGNVTILQYLSSEFTI